MISAKNLIFNAATKVDVSAKKQDSSNIELNSTQKTEKNEDNSQEAINSNAFVLLLAQVLSNAPDEGVDTNISDELKNVHLDLTNTNNNSAISTNPENVNIEQQLQVDPQIAADTTANQSTAIDANLALTWIQSESFQSLSASKQLPNESGPVNQGKVPVSVESTLTNKAIPDSKVPTEIDPNLSTRGASDKTPVNLMQNFDRVMAATNTVAKEGESSVEDVLLQNSIPAGSPGQAQQTATPAPKSVHIGEPVTSPQWADKFAEQIVWLGNQGIKSALIKIHPEELGPLEINITVVKDSASVNILSHNSQVRDIVDQAIPRLRDMMAEQGLNLTNVQVDSDQKSRQFSQHGRNDEQDSSSDTTHSSEEEVQLVSSIKKPPKRLVDYFA